MPKVSIIIPVYNVEPSYINDAINSALNQTLDDIEIIVVNDGSTDIRTLEYLKTVNNPKIKLINQENKGLGGARNTGISNATGDFIGFLDSDDWLDKNFYEVLYNLCIDNNADIACGTLTRVGSDYKSAVDKFDNRVVNNFIEKMHYVNNGSTCSKLFNKKLFVKTRYKEKIYYEDNPVLVELFANSGNVVFTNTVNYYYRENPKSICLNPEISYKRNNDKLLILQDICEIIKNKSQEEKDVVLKIFTPILVDKKFYKQPNVKAEVNKILGRNYKKYLIFPNKNSFLENIFSLKNSDDKRHKIITVLGIKFKIRRKPKNHA